MTNPAFGFYKFSFRHRFFWYLYGKPQFPLFLRKFISLFFPSFWRFGPFDVECSGLRFRLYPVGNWGDRRIIRSGRIPEIEELIALSPYIFRGMTFIDIGANTGYYSCYVSRETSDDLTLLSFEPQPETYSRLLYNLELNGVCSKNVLNCALGDEVGELDLWSNGSSGEDSLIPMSSAIFNTKVSVYPLLDICTDKGIDKIDILKIDIEGYEDRVLNHFFTNAPSSLLPKVILIETALKQEWSIDLLKLFSTYGYTAIIHTKRNTIFHR